MSECAQTAAVKTSATLSALEHTPHVNKESLTPFAPRRR